MFCDAIFIAIYWTLCAYCEIISAKTLTQKKIYVWCWPIMFAAAYYIVEALNIVLNTFMAVDDREKRRSSGKRRARRFKIFAGSVMSDKDKRRFIRSASNGFGQQCCLVYLCLLFVVSDMFGDRINSHIAFKLYSRTAFGVDDLQRNAKQNRIQYRTILASQNKL